MGPIWPRARKVTSILVPQFPAYLVTWLPDTGYLVLFGPPGELLAWLPGYLVRLTSVLSGFLVTWLPGY